MLNVQRRLAAQILKCGTNRVSFDPDMSEEIKKAITKNDVRNLIRQGLISRKRLMNTSSFWTKKRKAQKAKGRQKGMGSRKGKKTARLNPKSVWINKIRLQRNFIKSLKEKNVAAAERRELYLKSKGGFFRSLRHLKLYASERGIIKK